MKINFPYSDVAGLEISCSHQAQLFNLKEVAPECSAAEMVKNAIEKPAESTRLSKLAINKSKILIVADDISRPTPIYEFVGVILSELSQAGIKDEQIEFLIALGTHRAMNKDEMVVKLGNDIVKRYKIHNHNWKDSYCLDYIGDTEQGVPVWINKLVSKSDLVIGIGSIMPIEVCGFTGGGKILVPGVSGQVTVDQMHWTRMDVPSNHIIGKANNPIRASIDSLARKAGLDFIVNVVLNTEGKIIAAVAGDMVKAHRLGCEIAKDVFTVNIAHEFDIVIADSYPFDIEFWQANKALDTAGEVVKKGGVVILIAPCYEGFSKTHNEMLDFGYQSIEKIKDMVNNGIIEHKVVGVHMAQVSAVAVEKAKLILVSGGISKEEAEKVGFIWAQTAQKAFEKGLDIVGQNPSIAILKGASRMLALVNNKGD